jgi:hypothetical protein
MGALRSSSREYVLHVTLIASTIATPSSATSRLRWPFPVNLTPIAAAKARMSFVPVVASLISLA